MSAQRPFLEIRGPEGSSSRFELIKERVTIGRFPDVNDIALEPDPQRLITRVNHCALKRDQASWSLADNGSANRTFLKRGSDDGPVVGRVLLDDGDVIRILARLEAGKEPEYWELTFCDPQRTLRAGLVPLATYLHYDPLQARLFRVTGSNQQEVSNLRPQEHRLIRYMARRNRESGNVAVMCAYDEMIHAIWGDEVSHTESEVNHLIWELRQKLEPDSGNSQLLQLVRGLGYRLDTR